MHSQRLTALLTVFQASISCKSMLKGRTPLSALLAFVGGSNHDPACVSRMQADIFERTLGLVPCTHRQPHAVVIGTEMLKERYEVAVTAPTVHLRQDALQQVGACPQPPSSHYDHHERQSVA